MNDDDMNIDEVNRRNFDEIVTAFSHLDEALGINDSHFHYNVRIVCELDQGTGRPIVFSYVTPEGTTTAICLPDIEGDPYAQELVKELQSQGHQGVFLKEFELHEALLWVKQCVVKNDWLKRIMDQFDQLDQLSE